MKLWYGNYQGSSLSFDMTVKLSADAPTPERPDASLNGRYLCVVAPLIWAEACYAVPAVRALRNFRSELTVAILCPESQRPLWERVSELNHILCYPEKASVKVIGQLFKAHQVNFDTSLCWEAGNALKACYRAGIPQRLGYPAKGLEKYLTKAIEVTLEPGPIQHRVRHYLHLLEPLGVKPFVKESFLTAPLQPAPKRPLVALSPSSEYGVTHQWPVEKFKDLICLVENENGGRGRIDWVILSSDEDSREEGVVNELRAVLRDRGDQQQAPTGKWDREAVFTKLPQCSALVACDNEIAHMAAHVGLPSVVIFGPNEPAWKRPLGKQSRVVREHVACSPCYLAKCPIDMRCQTEVSVAMVASQLKAALEERYSSSS